MKRRLIFCVLMGVWLMQGYARQSAPPAPCGPLPDERQLAWHSMEYYAFIHFSINTFTDQEWGDGSNNPKVFNPSDLDCRQWARVCKAAGMKGIILTAKHHDGFCLWPSKYTEYSVKNSPWRDGKGDLVRELSDACAEYGLKFGIYLSPWDRNRADYGKPSYITYFRNQLRELLTGYGDIFEVWFDGANGGWGYYGGAKENRKIDRAVYYDWGNTIKLIRDLQPNAIIWNECGPDIRWCGNESGSIGETNWNTFDAHEFVPGVADSKILRVGREGGSDWVPGEVNVSVRPGWFYHTYEDGKVKSLSQLLDIYYNSIGRGSTLLLNFPIDREGRIHVNDEKAVLGLKKAIDEIYAVNLCKKATAEASHVRGNDKRYGANKAIDGKQDTYWTTDDNEKQAAITIRFRKATKFNRILLQEYIRLGQRVKAFKVEALVGGEWREMAKETTIGYKRILRIPTVVATQLRVSILDAKACPAISDIEVYNAPQILTPPDIMRNQKGEIIVRPADKESSVFYTLDDTDPTEGSARYVGPVATDGKVVVRAVSIDEATGRQSSISREVFGVSRKEWKVISSDSRSSCVIDGDVGSNYHQRGVMPADLVIDLGKEQLIKGFRYLPDQSNLFPSGIITFYEFYVSKDGSRWELVNEGEFSNIRNNPLWQTKEFAPVRARYVRFRALKNTQGDKVAGYSEIDVVVDDEKQNAGKL